MVAKYIYIYIYVYYFYIFLLSISNVCILFTYRLSTLRGTRRELEQELMVVNKAAEILIVIKLAKLSYFLEQYFKT